MLYAIRSAAARLQGSLSAPGRPMQLGVKCEVDGSLTQYLSTMARFGDRSGRQR